MAIIATLLSVSIATALIFTLLFNTLEGVKFVRFHEINIKLKVKVSMKRLYLLLLRFRQDPFIHVELTAHNKFNSYIV